MRIIKGIARNFSYLLAAQGIYKLLSFLTFIFIARYLGAEVFGRMSYVLSFTALFVFAADLGLSGLLVREMAGESQERREAYINNIGTLKLLLSLATYILMLCIALILREKRELIVLIAAFGLVVILDSYTVFLKCIFQVFERMEYEAASIIFEGVLKLGLMLLIIRHTSGNIYLVSAAFFLVSFLTLGLTVFITRSRFMPLGLRFDIKLWKKAAIGGMPFAFLMLFQTVNLKIDTVMLSKMTNDAVTGWFSAAARIIEPILIIPVSFTVALFPVASRLSKTSGHFLVPMFNRAFKLLLLGGVVISAVLVCGARLYIPLLFGGGFTESIAAIRVLGFMLAPVFLRLFLDSFSLALNRSRIVFFSYIIGALLNICLNLAFIGRFNYMGACWATLLAEIITIIFYFFWVRKELLRALSINMRPVVQVFNS